MQMGRFGIAIILLGAVLLVFGFLTNRSPQTSTQTEEEHLLAGTSTSAGDYEYKETGNYYEVTVHYPAKTRLEGVSDARARLAIEQTLVERIAEFKQNTKVDTLTPEDAAYQNLGEGRKYSLTMEYKTYAAPAHVSYLYSMYEDTGGAHPNSYFLTFVFDKEGNKIALPALFSQNQNWLKKLSTLVTSEVEAQFKARANVDSTEGLLFTEGLAPKEENFQNFVVDGNELRIFIPPYQVAAYAAGSFEVNIPLRELQ